MRRNSRILIIDDNRAIHEDFRKILGPKPRMASDLAAIEDVLFGDGPSEAPPEDPFDITSAFQGQDGFELVKRAASDGSPFALAFVDVRMPPGWDGVQTVLSIWQVAPNLPVVICTAFSDYSTEEITAKLGTDDRLVILRKPFHPPDVQRLASRMVEQWSEN